MNTVEQRLRAALHAKSDAVKDDRLDAAAELTPRDEIVWLAAPRQVPAPRDTGDRRRRSGAVLVAASVVAVLALTIGIIVAGQGRSRSVSTVHDRAEVPWSQVGADWTLVVAFDGARANREDLYLASPAGTRYLICLLPASMVVPQRWTVTTGKAILRAEGEQRASNDVLIVDLHTGAQTRITLATKFDTVRFATPALDSLLVIGQSSTQLLSIATGQVLLRYPAGDAYGSALSPDGTQLVVGGLRSLTVFDFATGRRVRTLAGPAGYGYCGVLRWLPASTEVLAQCSYAATAMLSTDFRFSVDGGQPPRPAAVPAGWHEVALAAGTIAYLTEVPTGSDPQGLQVARVTAAGRLSPLPLPAELDHDTWRLTQAGADVLLFEEYAGPVPTATAVKVVAWNPLTGRLTTLIAAAKNQRAGFLYTAWQASDIP